MLILLNMEHIMYTYSSVEQLVPPVAPFTNMV